MSKKNTFTIFAYDVNKDKWDVSYDVGYGQILEMSEWIAEQFETFWETTSVKK